MLKELNGLDSLKKLNINQLSELCDEIRKDLLKTVMTNGGHLASNLGVVELTVALHYVFDDTDKIIWDVGHQSYVHKILTNRIDKFCTLRKKGGISGFPSPEESKHDSFGVGHASTAISAGLGIAKARDIQNQNFDVISVVGDGALTGGLSYEGLNSIGSTKMFIILNDNNMAIDKNVGSATKNLSRVRISKKYLQFKKRTKKFLKKLPLIGNSLLSLSKKVARNIRLKKLHNIYFENFNIRYIGPINGHDLKELIFYLSEIKNNADKPTVLHVLTQKGKGYLPAEQEPNKFHGITPKNNKTQASMSEIVGRTLSILAIDNPKITVITAAMADGTGTSIFRKTHPDRFFDVGIAEEHAVTFSAGLATQGMKPYVAIYSTFLQRAYDQILHDVCLQNLPVTFCIDRAGFVGEDGKTHQGLFDISYLSTMPNLILLTPASPTQLEKMLEWSTTQNTPIAIRYPKASYDNKNIQNEFKLAEWHYFGDLTAKNTILAIGPNAFYVAFSALEQLKSSNVRSCVIQVSSIKPLDEELLNKVADKQLLITIEEGMLTGGFASIINTYYSTKELRPKKIVNIGVDDKFVAHSTINEQLEEYGITTQNIINIVLQNNN